MDFRIFIMLFVGIDMIFLALLAAIMLLNLGGSFVPT